MGSLELQPASWSAGGSLETDLDQILATAAEGSLPDSLPEGAGSLGSLEGETPSHKKRVGSDLNTVRSRVPELC